MPRTEAWGGGPALALERSLDAACEAAGAMEEMLRDMADDAKRVTTEASMCVGRMAARRCAVVVAGWRRHPPRGLLSRRVRVATPLVESIAAHLLPLSYS